jgi:hypothetical protein
MADLDDIEYAVDEVRDAVTRVEAAVKAVPSVIGWVFVGALVAFGIDLISTAWHSKLRYSIQYDVATGKITVEKEPHDCNFFAAPIGNKYCEYERSVLVVRWATSTSGTPIISYDDGKTWSAFTPDAGVTVPQQSTVKEVDISWSKKES